MVKPSKGDGKVVAKVQTNTNLPQDMVELGRIGGLVGGPARARALSAKRRSEISRHAALVRWGTKGKTKRRRRPAP